MVSYSLDSFRQVWLIDFEFAAPPGERPTPVCMVGRELRSGQTIQLWQDQLLAPPFQVGPDTLIVAYYASAEIGCFLALGWPMPVRVLDLFTEFRCITNGLSTPHGRGLLGALLYFGLDALDAVEKDSMRALAMRGGPWTADERQSLLEYCQSDVESLERLLPVMLPSIDLPRALLRGRYMCAAARIERAGVPIDVETYSRFVGNWERVLEIIVREYDVYGLYDENLTFKLHRFKEWLVERDLSWPYLDTGHLALDSDAFEMVAALESPVEPIAKLRAILSELRVPDKLAIGADGRNRCLSSVFGSRTGRNQPSGAKYIFGPAAWLRGLIQPEPGRAVAYTDWSQQEFGVGAALSNDSAMIEAYLSGDPYLQFGKQSKRIPPDGDEITHKAEREQCKRCVLATQYGMGPTSLARQIKQPPAYAMELLELHKKTYPKYWQWSDSIEITGMLGGSLRTCFGWPLHVVANANPRSLRNFPIQAHGSELLRLACCLLTERGINVVAPVHDAALVEAAVDDIEEVAIQTQQAMAEASAVVLGGFTLRSKSQIVKYPERLLDDKTRPMWDRVVGILGTI